MTNFDAFVSGIEGGTWGNPIDIFPSHAAHMDGFAAFSGSLDAAKRLHGALLPGWGVEIVGPTTDDEWIVNLPEQDSAFASHPARAWLLAILRAVKAKG